MPSNRNRPERPRGKPESTEREIVEPEIIPPGKEWPNRRPGWPPQYGFSESRSTHRVYVGRIGPLGFAILVLIVAMFGGVLLLALIGAVLIWLPVLAVLAVIAAITGLIRRL
jgi:hypothetical protein